jgi:hypothetical protein
MTRERALWEAVATVCIPSATVWILAAFFLRKYASLEEWPIYLFFFALPLPLIFPIYRRYRLGVAAVKLRSRRYHVGFAVLGFSLAIAMAVETWLDHRHRLDTVSQLLGIGFWLVTGFEQTLKARRMRPGDAADPNVTF